MSKQTYDLSACIKESVFEWEKIRNLSSQNINILLSGFYGVGKSAGAIAIAQELGREPIRIALSGDSLSQECTGFFIISSQGSQFNYGCITHPYTNTVLIVDEIDKTNESVQTSLLPILDGKPVRLLNGEQFTLRTPVICTANILQNIQPALLDRLWQIEVTTPHPSFFSTYPAQISIGCMRLIKDNQSPRNLLRLYSLYTSEYGRTEILETQTWIDINKRYGMPFELLATVSTNESI